MTKQNQIELLPEELLWADGGHASDVVLTAMADGQVQLVPEPVLLHVNGCALCTTHLGNAALLSLHTGRELAVLDRLGRADQREEVAQKVRAPFPKLAVALGLAFAILGVVPSLADVPAQLGGARSFATHDVPLLFSGLSLVGHRLFASGSPAALAATYGSAALVVIMAVVLIRLLPKKEVS